MTRILVTGSRAWTARPPVSFALAAAAIHYGGSHNCTVTLVHGGARGLDLLAADIVTRWNQRWGGGTTGWVIEEHPADWATCGKAAGGIRNQRMVDLGADACLAFPLPGSRGTWDCVRRAEAAGIPVHVHAPSEVTP